MLRTSKEAQANAKEPWKIKVEGQIEQEFLFGTVLAKDLVPFSVRKLSLVALPVSNIPGGSLTMVNSEQALAAGNVHAYDWFRRAEAIWEADRKTESHSIYEWLNYNSKLTNQPFGSPFFVLYNQSGTNIAAAIINPEEAKRIGPLAIQGFIVDSKCYWYATDCEEEAQYLVGILNSEVVNMAIKPLQTQGLQGERDIHRRPFEACNIPLFDQKSKRHLRIAELAKECRTRLLPLVPKMDASVAKMRGEARELVTDIMTKTNDEVVALLKSRSQTQKKRRESTTNRETLF